MNKSSFKVSGIGEKGLIERIISKNQTCSISNNYLNIDCNDFKSIRDFNSFYSSFIGDDASLINDFDENYSLLTSSDMLIQTTHFPKAMTPYQMGFKSVVVNMSDLIAMGAKPLGFLLNIAIPKDMLLDDFDNLICGVIQACDKYNLPLIGGDTVEASEIIISGTAIGYVEKNKAIMKYGFETGDLVCISDELGLAALGFELLNDSTDKESHDKIKTAKETDSSLTDLAIFKALSPDANYDNGRILAKYKENHNISATDITDGLASELYELLNSDKKFNSFLDNFSNIKNELNVNNSNINNKNEYKKGIKLYEDKLPIEKEFKEISAALNLDYLNLFLHVGEDFELLFTIPPQIEKNLKEEMNFYVIGEVTDNNTVEILLSDGNSINVSSEGYNHLSE